MFFRKLTTFCKTRLLVRDLYPDQEVLYRILKDDLPFNLKEELGSTLAKILRIKGPQYTLPDSPERCKFANKQAVEIINELEVKGLSFINVNDLEDSFDQISSDITRNCRSYLVSTSTGKRSLTRKSKIDPDIRLKHFDSSDLLESASVRKFLSNDLMHRLVSNYLGAPGVVSSVSSWYSLPTTAPPIGFELFHRDRADFRSLNLFVYLSDVNLEAGPHEFFLGSHRSVSLQNDPIAKSANKLDTADLLCMHRPDSKKLKDHYGQPLTITGEKFTAFFEDTRGFHRALQPRTESRLIFQIVWTLIRQRTGNDSRVRYAGPALSPLTQYSLSHLYTF